METKNFWLMTDAEKQNAIKGAIKFCFGKDAFLKDFSIDFSNTDGYITIGYYDALLKESELNLFKGYLEVLDTCSKFFLRRRQDDAGLYYLTIMYSFKRNK